MDQHNKSLYLKPAGVKTRWASFENPEAQKGAGGKSNRAAKGKPHDSLRAGETKTLLNVQGSGLVTRIWMTVGDRSPKMLRSLRLDMYWDGASRPAVSAPLGDFFGVGLGRRTRFENELFSDPEGRSFVCSIPMPFRKGGRITLTNEADKDQAFVFYDVDLLIDVPHEPTAMYFHAHFRRETNALGENFTILPTVKGAGRFLGTNLGITGDPRYKGTWFGEGEVKAWIDGDGEFPTLCGTGTEDYIGTAWGQGLFCNRTQGCLLADDEHQQWAFFRYHTDDPIYFDHDFRIEIQALGGAGFEKIVKLEQEGTPAIPVTVDHEDGTQWRLFDRYPGGVKISDVSGAKGWCNFFRQDDWSATAYFYLDKPENDLPPCPSVAERTKNLVEIGDGTARADT